MKVGWEGGEIVGMMGKKCERNGYEGILKKKMMI